MQLLSSSRDPNEGRKMEGREKESWAGSTGNAWLLQSGVGELCAVVVVVVVVDLDLASTSSREE
jgi:hypothetical protein